MMAPKREYGQQAFELPARRPLRGKPAPIYSDQMAKRRQQVSYQQRQRQLLNAKEKLMWAICGILAAGFVIMCGMHIYQGALASQNAYAITSLKDEIHELIIDAETYECQIADAASDENILPGAQRLGMSYPTDGQVHSVQVN